MSGIINGFVTDIKDSCDYDEDKLKEIVRVTDSAFILMMS